MTIDNVTPCTGNAFAGWTNAVIATPQATAPTELHKGSYTIPSDATGEITLYAVYAQGGEATETLKYVSDESVYMDGSNEADKVGLDNTKWSVVGDAGTNTNKPYLHKDDEIRLYWTSGKVNTLTISSLVGSSINRIEVTYRTSAGSEVVVGGNVVAGTETGTSNEYAYPINASSFVVRPSTAQIQVKQIEMVVSTYSNYSTTCTENTDEVAVTGVTLLPAQLSLEKGQTSTLTASIAPSNATNQNLTWTSSKESVATVDNGVVTAVAAGKATITVTTEDGEFTATCVVTVTEPSIPVEGVYYELTELANIKPTDEVLYVAKVGEKYYAMSNDGAGTKGQPSAVEVSVVDNKITTDATNVQWNVAKLNDNIETLTFYSVGQSKWLYCINDNNGLRLGTGTTATESNTFKVANGYLCNNKQTRYIGVYNQQDWRSYTGTSTNINDQTFGFYVKHSTLPIITVAPATHDFGLVEVNQSASVTLTIMSENVTALNASITNTTDYSISAITNAADGNKQITVTYHPTNGNAHEATLTIASTTVGEEASFDVTLSGQGMVVENSIWTLVEDVNDLQVGDQIVIAAAEYDYALSTNQKTNNRDAVTIINNGDGTIKIHSLVQVITLEEGVTSGTWSFNVGAKGYLYADGVDENLLKSKTTKDANGSWTISITDGKASVLGQGGNARETMLYNNNNEIFSCYADETKGKAIAIYKKQVYTRDVTNKYGTICLPYASASTTGAYFYEVAGTEEGKVYLASVDALEAGVPYIFEATASTIKVVYTGEAVDAPQNDDANGLVGTFTEITVPDGDYILYEDAFCTNEPAGTLNKIRANRAYLNLDAVEGDAPVQMPGRRYIGMSVQGENGETGFENITAPAGKTVKAIVNGQLIIIRDGEMYNAQGQRL